MPQCLGTVPNILQLIAKSLRSAYDVKAYILLIVMGAVSLMAPLLLFEKSWLMPTSGFFFTFPLLSSLYKNTTHTLILDVFSYIQLLLTLYVEVLQKLKMDDCSAFISSIAGLKCLTDNKGRH